LLGAALLGTVQMASAADITGKVTLKGTPAPEKPLPIDLKEPTCGALHKTVPTTRFYAVGKNGELADVFIHLKDGLTGKTIPVLTEPAVLDQVKCEYVPYVSGLQTKQKLLVKNSDPFMHNVHPTPTVAGNKESNKAQMANSKPFEYVFEAPEVFLRFKCDVHPWMFSYVGVLNHPFFAVTDAEGNFKIANVPPGDYTVEAIHRKTHAPSNKGVAQKVTVGPDGAKVNFTIEVAAQ
jgi:hypothetical protein